MHKLLFKNLLIGLISIYATQVTDGQLPHTVTGQSNVKNILDIAFGIIGSLAVLMMTISGLKYIASSGDPQKTAEAKSGILYALIGLAIAILSTAIVSYVIKNTA